MDHVLLAIDDTPCSESELPYSHMFLTDSSPLGMLTLPIMLTPVYEMRHEGRACDPQNGTVCITVRQWKSL